MRMMRYWLAFALPTYLALAGCPGPSSPSFSGAYPSPQASGGALNDLVKQASQAEAELQENLNTPMTLNFPIKLGVLFFNYNSDLKPEDQQEAITTLRQELLGTGLVASMVRVPSSLVSPADSLETIRRLVSRFGVDTVLVVSGSHEFRKADTQPLGFFESFSNKAYYESRTTLTALGMNVLTGRFMPPIQAVGKEGPTLLNPDEGNFGAGRYELQKGAELKAMTELKTQFTSGLQLIKANATPAPAASASPTPSPSESASPSPSPSATPAG